MGVILDNKCVQPSIFRPDTHTFLSDFWLPAASGGAALEANITVVLVLVLLLMSFTRNLLFDYHNVV